MTKIRLLKCNTITTVLGFYFIPVKLNYIAHSNVAICHQILHQRAPCGVVGIICLNPILKVSFSFKLLGYYPGILLPLIYPRIRKYFLALFVRNQIVSWEL